jgi:segregation and condensation protein A
LAIAEQGRLPESPVDANPAQEQLPFARLQGEPITRLPTDLYIPPEALEVFLEAFEGPLDLLLWLIKKQNLDILDVPIADVARQYSAYVDLMGEMQFELAAEYLVMAAMLAEIKSRMLLPRPPEDEGEEEDDPRAELIRRLQEYERYKRAAGELEELPRIGRDLFPAYAEVPADVAVERAPPAVAMSELIDALSQVLERARMFTHHHIHREQLSVRERMTAVMGKVSAEEFTPFEVLFDLGEGKAGVIVTFLALLELMRESLLEIAQNEPFGPIYVRAAA